MQVADVIQSNVVSISSQSTVPEAERVMHECGVRHVPVVDDGVLLGLVSARDLAHARSSAATSVPRPEVPGLLDRLTAQEIMSRPVIVVEPTRALEDAVRLMRVEGISALPVTDAGRLVGLLTEDDVLDLFLATARAAVPSSRVEVTVPASRSGLAGVIRTIEQAGVPIVELTTFTARDGRRHAIIHLRTIDPRRAIVALRADGYVGGDLWTTGEVRGGVSADRRADPSRASDPGGSREPRSVAYGDSRREAAAADPAGTRWGRSVA
ncbi:MAG: CBS and ACT domain-containing protein [Candidatus Rokuibacteriota bacterium]